VVANSVLSNAGDSDITVVFNYLQDNSIGTAAINATGPNLRFGNLGNTAGTISGTAFVVVDPELGPLRDNGGFTPTMAPRDSFSPVIDAGSNAASAGLTTDQRGFGPRSANGLADLGAFEFGATAPPAPPAPRMLASRQLTASLETVRQRRTRKKRLKIVVRYADTGAVKTELNSPFQKGAYTQIAVLTIDSNGDGAPDAVQISAIKVGLRKRAVQRVFSV
jgi:hypothetical protein